MKDKLLRMIRSIVRRAIVSLSLEDTGDYPLVQISYLGKTAKAEVIWPYGMGGRLPVDAIFFNFNIEGMEENKAGIGTQPKLRVKVDAEGEVWFGNPLTQSISLYKANGDNEETIKGDKKIIAENIEIGAEGSILRALIDERIIAIYNAHTHSGVTVGGGATGIPVTPLIPGNQETTNFKAS